MKLAFSIFILGLLQCFAGEQIAEYYSQETEGGDEISGIALVIHGLNTRPSKMEGILNELTKRGIYSVLLSLDGHFGDIESMKKVSREGWIENVSSAMKRVSTLKSKFQKTENEVELPFFFIGFSLGAQIFYDYLSVNKSILPTRAILFAPAFRVRNRSHLIKSTFIFGGNFIIPSASPKSYQAQKGTSVNAYRGLFASIRSLKDKRNLDFLNFPTSIFFDPKDELISVPKLKRMILREKWDQAKFIEVSNEKSTLEKPYHHLIIDKDSLGLEEWSKKVLPEFDKLN